jgi:hypothetical protein
MPLHPDHQAYFHFTPQARRDRDLNELFGIVEGTTIDSMLNDREVAYLRAWLDKNADLRTWHPYSGFFTLLEDALADGVLTAGEQADLCGACRILTSTEYYDRATAVIQRLHGILAGIGADGVITKAELDGLQNWLEAHSPWLGGWPCEELVPMIDRILADGRIDPSEQTHLQAYFGQFTSIKPSGVGSPTAEPESPAADGPTLHSILDPDPILVFPNRTFCFTGASARYKRKDLKATVERLGGKFTNTINRHLDYLIVGTEGNPCWTYSCYGRKIEDAVEFQIGLRNFF